MKGREAGVGPRQTILPWQGACVLPGRRPGITEAKWAGKKQVQICLFLKKYPSILSVPNRGRETKDRTVSGTPDGDDDAQMRRS